MHCMSIMKTTNFSGLAASVHCSSRSAKNPATPRRLSTCPFVAVIRENGSQNVLKAGVDIWVGLPLHRRHIVLTLYCLVLLERVYAKPGLPVKRYGIRGRSLISWGMIAGSSWKIFADIFTPCPPPCLHHSERDSESRSPRRPLKRTYAQASMWQPLRYKRFESAIVTDLNDTPPLGVTAIDWHYETDWQKIVRLNCLEWPGLSEKEFFGLFAKCEVCGLVVARQVFHYHYCRLVGEDGLKLTDREE